MILTYSGRSAPSALKIAEASDGFITPMRGNEGDVNWGRATANTELNPNINTATNKRIMRELFQEQEVPSPQLCATELVARDWVMKGKTLIGRPDYHSRGRGYWFIRTTEDLTKALRGTRRKKAATHFMEFVEAEHEVRVHIFKGKSIRISEKSFFTNDRGERDYTTIKPTVNVKYARRAAKKAVEALGLDFGAVDVLVKSDGTPYVLEVNAAPGLGGSMPRLYADTFERWQNGEFDE